jgi:hypothetical protein
MKNKQPALAVPNNNNAPRVSNSARARARRIAKWQGKFITALSKLPSVKHACKSAGISRRTAYDYRESDALFAKRWAEALEHSVDDLEAKAFKLALEGEDQVAASLVQWLLRCHRPNPYDPVNRAEFAVAAGVIILPAKENKAP